MGTMSNRVSMKMDTWELVIQNVTFPSKHKYFSINRPVHRKNKLVDGVLRQSMHKPLFDNWQLYISRNRKFKDVKDIIKFINALESRIGIWSYDSKEDPLQIDYIKTKVDLLIQLVEEMENERT